jgi:aflatoxin B1 aldehyde reductase
VLGTMNICYPYSSNIDNKEEEYFNILQTYCLEVGEKRAILDTAYYYGNTKTEEKLGELIPKLPFVPKIASKVNPWFENDFNTGLLGQLSRTPMLHQFQTSLSNLKIETMETLFLHCPDYNTPIDETIDTIQYLWRNEKINSWGMSNYSLSQVKDIINLCEKKQFEPPLIYQGMYNVLCRKVEEIQPLLDEYNMFFWGYNPLAGGLLTGKYMTSQENEKPNRFSNNKIYQTIFWKQNIIKQLEVFYPSSKEQAIDYAFSWLLNHSMIESPNNKLVLGVSTEKQLKENIMSIHKNKKMRDDQLCRLNELYSNIEADSPNYYY